MLARNWNHDEFATVFKENLAYLKRVKNFLRNRIDHVMHKIADPKLVRTGPVEFRIKDQGSLARKAQQRGWRPDQALWSADDLIGARVVCNNIEDVYRFRELLEEKLPTEVTEQDYISKPGDAGYRALHLNFRLGVSDNKSGFLFDVPKKEVGCEVQIRSLLQDVWARLSHADIYKGDGLPADLRERMTDLSGNLSSADQIASRIRKRVEQVRTPDDGESVESRLVRSYADVFGKAPSDYVIRETSDVASQLNEYQWEKLPSLLRDPSFKRRVDAIYRKAFGFQASVSERFTTSVRAIANTEDAALSHLQRIVDEEVEELDQVGRREILSEMPDSIADFIERIERVPESIVPCAEVLSATKHCSVCGKVLVNPDALEESLAEYYDLEEVPGVYSALAGSSLQIPDHDDPHLCMYHGEQFRKN